MQQNVQDLIRAFEHDLKRERKAATVAAYVAAIREFQGWLQASYGASILDADETDVREWQRFLREKRGQRPATINRKLNGLRKFFQWASARGLAQPLKHVEWERDARPRPRALSPDTVRRILRAARKSGKLRDWAFLEVLASTGLRVSEAVALRRKDLHVPQRGTIWITVERGKRNVRYRIPIEGERAKLALRRYLDTLPQDPETRVFPFSRETAWRIVQRHARAAGIQEKVSPHAFRHTVITILVRTRDLATAQAWAGHASVTTTARYAQPGEQELEAAARALEW